MTLREALQKLNKEKIVKEAIAKHETVKELPEKEKEKKTEMLKRGYENAIRELLLLEKSDSEGKILVDWFLDLYLDVWLVSNAGKQDLIFCDWKDFIDSKIQADKKILEENGLEKIAGLILWEITHWGFGYEKVMEKLKGEKELFEV